MAPASPAADSRCPKSNAVGEVIAAVVLALGFIKDSDPA